MKLSPTVEKFVLHWGEMGPRWGVNRSVAQVHALLYLSEEPLTAEEICETLSIARSNVSTCLKELQGWGIVHTTSVMGDRRDHFESLRDVWEMFETVAEERKKREIDPTMRLLRDCIEESSRDKKTSAEVARRLKDMLAFFEVMDAWYGHMRRLPRAATLQFLKMGRRIHKLLGAKA